MLKQISIHSELFVLLLQVSHLLVKNKQYQLYFQNEAVIWLFGDLPISSSESSSSSSFSDFFVRYASFGKKKKENMILEKRKSQINII